MTGPLWSVAEMAKAMRARIAGSPSGEALGISIDSRAIDPGDAFFAIAGDRFDGHDFAADAIAAGASVAVVSEARAGGIDAGDGCLLIVPDVLDALCRLGRAARHRSSAGVVAVTGSAGKTGTKEALRLALSASGEVHASVKSFNNHWGVPLTLARMPESADFGVFEIGMNHAGEITPLTQMVKPHVAIVTTVAPVHIEFFSSVEAIAEAKAEIFVGLAPNGTAVIPADNPHAGLLQDRARTAGALNILTFGAAADADVRLLDAETVDGSTTVTADLLGRTLTYTLAVPGRHWVMNSLAVLAALAALDVDLVPATEALAAIRAPRGRGETHRLSAAGGEIVLIDESYNANPASMRAALDVMAATPVSGGGRRIVVLGDMLELGRDSPDFHAGLAEPIAAAGTDLVYAAGPQMQNLFDVLPPGLRGVYAKSSQYILDPLLADLRAGDVVMVKGSLGSRMGPVVDAIKARFGDCGRDDLPGRADVNEATPAC